MQMLPFVDEFWSFADHNHKILLMLAEEKQRSCCVFPFPLPLLFFSSSSHCSDDSSIPSATDGMNDEKPREGRAGMRAGDGWIA